MKGMVNVNPSDKQIYVMGGLILLVGVAVYFGVLKPITNKLGLTDSKDDREKDKLVNTLESGSAFNSSQEQPTGATISTDKAKELAKEIYDAMGYFNDCEECVYGAIAQAGSKKNLQKVSYNFYQEYKQDLLGYLQNYFSESELAEVQKRVAKLK